MQHSIHRGGASASRHLLESTPQCACASRSSTITKSCSQAEEQATPSARTTRSSSCRNNFDTARFIKHSRNIGALRAKSKHTCECGGVRSSTQSFTGTCDSSNSTLATGCKKSIISPKSGSATSIGIPFARTPCIPSRTLFRLAFHSTEPIQRTQVPTPKPYPLHRSLTPPCWLWRNTTKPSTTDKWNSNEHSLHKQPTPSSIPWTYNRYPPST